MPKVSLSFVPNYYEEPIVVTTKPIVTRQKKVSLFFILFSTSFVLYFTYASVTNYFEVEYKTETAAAIPLPAIYNAESGSEKQVKYGQVLVGFINSMWKSKVPVVSGQGKNPKTGVWNSAVLEAVPEIPLSIYMFKEGGQKVEGFLHQSFSGPTRCTEQLLTESELHNDDVFRRSIVDIGTSTIDGVSRVKIGAQDGSNGIEFREFPFPSLVTDDYEVFTSYGDKEVTRVSSKLCGATE